MIYPISVSLLIVLAVCQASEHSDHPLASAEAGHEQLASLRASQAANPLDAAIEELRSLQATLSQGREEGWSEDELATVHKLVQEQQITVNAQRAEEGVLRPEHHDAVGRSQTLRERIQSRLQKARSQPQVENEPGASHGAKKGPLARMPDLPVSLEQARFGLLNPTNLALLSSALARAGSEDQSLDEAVRDALKKKAAETRSKTTLSLEERLALQEIFPKKMKQVSKDLSDVTDKLLAKHSSCERCKKDCPAFNWHKYDAHSMKQCKAHCEVMVCQESWDPKVSYEERLSKYKRDAPLGFADPGPFTNFLDEFSEEHGLKGSLGDKADLGAASVVWEAPGEAEGHRLRELVDTVQPDPLQELRTLPPKAPKSLVEVLSSFAKEEGLVAAFET